MKKDILSDLFFCAIPISLIILSIGLLFNSYGTIIISGFVLAMLLIILTTCAALDLGWIKDKPTRPTPKQTINIFMQPKTAPAAAASSDADEYEEEETEEEEYEEEEYKDPFRNLDIIDNHGFMK